MASRIIHLAVIGELTKTLSFKDTVRLKVGAIIPDACRTREEKTATHYKTTLPNGTKTYDLTGFRRDYGELLPTDDLYLGYYLHLIQDILYRDFFYGKTDYDPGIPDNITKLHSDYSQINGYVIGKYGIERGLITPDCFDDEPILRQFGLDVGGFLKALESDFEPCEEAPLNYFTRDMADEHIALATRVCACEIDAMRAGEPVFDETDYAWGM